MGATRSIKYGSVSGGANSSGSVYSASETWGELKAEDSTIGALATGMGALVKRPDGTNIKLTDDNQQLPVGEFTIYFVTEKNNSGHGANR